MTDSISKSQIDKLGERLRVGKQSSEDFLLLDAYRQSFAEAFDATIGLINKSLNLVATGRPSKSTQSILEKLRRESIRLSQIQDIAGCRIPLGQIDHQEEVTSLLIGSAEYHGFKTTVLDRRAHPSYGYRAVHVICHVRDRWVEVQIRTELQHLWAQLSEKLSDIRDSAIKYGGGDALLRAELDGYSKQISDIESRELAIWQEKCHHGIRRCDDDLSICPPELIERYGHLQREREVLSFTLDSRLFDILYREKPDDISDPV